MALNLGRSIREARETHRDPFDAIAETLSTTLYSHVIPLFEGKVADVERRTTEGFARGTATIEATDGSNSELRLDFQNENLVATKDNEVVALVPDLICVTDAETAEPITTEGLRYGQRVKVIAISTPEMMRTSGALTAFGPAAFGLEHAFVPVETRSQHG